MKKKSAKHLCKDCKHCDIERKKCYPESIDCHSEYALTDSDIYETSDECDFFEKKE